MHTNAEADLVLEIKLSLFTAHHASVQSPVQGEDSLPGTCKMRERVTQKGKTAPGQRGGEGAVEQGTSAHRGLEILGTEVGSTKCLRPATGWDPCVCAQCTSELGTGLGHGTGDTDLERATVCTDGGVRSSTASHGYGMDLISVQLVEESHAPSVLMKLGSEGVFMFR